MIKLKNLSDKEVKELLPEDLILLGYRGSIAHNMYIPQEDPTSIDDKDILGVFIAPIEHYVGFGRKDIKEKFIKEYDAVSYEIRKFIGLLLNCNPNVLSLLWLSDKHYIYKHPLGQKLIDNKNIFVTKAAYHSFTGYAYGQLKRMTHIACKGYLGNKRKDLIEKFGFDTKASSHLIRLLKMGIEFLNEGVLYIERSDSEQLLEIKRGEWSLDKIKSEAERLFKLAEEAYLRSSLPPHPDRENAEKLLMEIVLDYYTEDIVSTRYPEHFFKPLSYGWESY